VAEDGLRWLKGLPFAAPARHEQEDVLKQAFLPFGNVENIKLIKEKGGGFGHLVRCDSRVCPFKTSRHRVCLQLLKY
jgi:hypothetical protein